MALDDQLRVSRDIPEIRYSLAKTLKGPGQLIEDVRTERWDDCFAKVLVLIIAPNKHNVGIEPVKRGAERPERRPDVATDVPPRLTRCAQPRRAVPRARWLGPFAPPRRKDVPAYVERDREGAPLPSCRVVCHAETQDVCHGRSSCVRECGPIRRVPRAPLLASTVPLWAVPVNNGNEWRYAAIGTSSTKKLSQVSQAAEPEQSAGEL